MNKLKKKFFLVPNLLISLGIILQAIYFFMLIFSLDRLSPVTHYIMMGMGIITALFIATGEDSAVYKLAWIIPILLFPAVFGLVYIFYNRRPTGRKVEADLLEAEKNAKRHINKNNILLKEDDFSNITDYLTASYIQNTGGFGCYFSEEAEYFKVGEEFEERFLLELKKAEKFIFIEFFIIKQGLMWDTILNILEEKAKTGVDVRIIYDGSGSFFTLPYGYYKKLREKGLKCMVFNPFRPLISARYNVRNHRKLAVIDGKTAFNCGLNLADNYINMDIKSKTGHWRDTSVMLKGGAAYGFTLMFLSMWEFLSREKTDYQKILPVLKNTGNEKKNITDKTPEKNAVCVWTDIPLDCEPLSERLYLNLICRAEKYIYITTPYLLPPSEVSAALCLAARSGIDVRIILPFIPDKFVIHAIGKSNYLPFLSDGVKIYEYAPGFYHGKNIIVDGKRAMLGTVNFDFRSMFMHHECGSTFFGGKIVDDMYMDFMETLKSCDEITIMEHSKAGVMKRGIRRALRIFAPFM